MKKCIVFILILISFSVLLSEDTKAENIDDIIAETWKMVVRSLKSEGQSHDKKVNLLNDFIKNTPENSKYNLEAKYFLNNFENTPERLKHLVNKERYINKTEWVAASFAGGNYGLGFNLSFFTIRWKNFFWESMRVQFTILPILDTWSINAKTMIGAAAYFGYANQHEIRLSTGLAGGMGLHKIQFPEEKEEREQKPNVTYIESDDEFTALINIPFEISYVFHVHEFFAFQAGITIDMPVMFYRSARESSYYIPIISSFIGFRI